MELLHDDLFTIDFIRFAKYRCRVFPFYPNTDVYPEVPSQGLVRDLGEPCSDGQSHTLSRTAWLFHSARELYRAYSSGYEPKLEREPHAHTEQDQRSKSER